MTRIAAPVPSDIDARTAAAPGPLGARSGSASLAALLAAVASGDRDAFKSLYNLTAPKLFGIVLRMVRDRAVAEEVLQDVFLRVWQNAGTFSSEAGEPMTWLASIARHRAIDVVRQRRETLVGPGEEGEDWLAAILDPRDGEAELIDRDRLRHCLRRLDAEQQSCLVRAYCEGLSREELAERHGRPVNTIKTWLHRGLLALRGCLDEVG